VFVLVINCGSSSVKASLFDGPENDSVVSVRIGRVGEAEATCRVDGQAEERFPCKDHDDALEHALRIIQSRLPDSAAIGAVGHRVVHGGEAFDRPVLIDAAVEETIASLAVLAPLHNPVNLAGIKAVSKRLEGVPQVAVFDTAFHQTLPRRARHYAIDVELAARHKVRRYGFHGISHAYVAQAAAEFLGEPVTDLRLITAHLGNGCSVAAVEYGRSIETSMGMTPLEGLVMGTRSGDLDPGALTHLMRAEGLDADGLDQLLNKRSGLAGLSGKGNDLRDIEAAAVAGDDRCRLAISVFVHRLVKYIGAYAAVMGGVDAVVFTAGIGENSALIRQRVVQKLRYLGVRLHEDGNSDVQLDQSANVAEISSSHSRVRVLVAATDEEKAIARDTTALVRGDDQTSTGKPIPVAVSARHIHLTQESVEALFGPGHRLTERNPLSQPGQFAANEVVSVVGPRSTIERVRILGPVRSKNQIEISRTDEYALGIDAPVRASGHVAETPGCSLVGPFGTVRLEMGVICAWRHIHMTPEDAVEFGVRNKDVVDVAVESGPRDLVFGDVLVRVSPKYKLEMHIDTDEANAADLSRGAIGVLVSTQGNARLQTRRLKPSAS
jgi:acetate kinase